MVKLHAGNAESRVGGTINQETTSDSPQSATTVMIVTAASRVFGFVRQAVISAIFGASGSADVINIVFNIPNNLRKLLAEGALSSAFVPVLSQAVVDTEAREQGVPQQVVRNLLSFQYAILIPVLILSTVFAGPITRFILDFPDPEKQQLAAQLFRYFIHYTLLVSISAVLVGSLNSSNRFLVPAVSPIVFSLCLIASVLLLQRTLGVFSMAVGVLLGGVGQVVFQVPQYRRIGYDFRPSFSFSNPRFRKILRQWLPVVAASSIFVVNQQVSLYFASGLEDGSSSALTNSIPFWQLPLGIFSVSIMTVLFPRMSRQATDSDRGPLRDSAGYGVRAIVALLAPSALLLSLLSHEVIAVALQRGRFTATNTSMTADVLVGYSYGLVFVGLFSFLQRFFYALGDYKTPTLTAALVLVVDVALSLWLKETSLRVAGLAVANSVAFTVGAVALLVAATRRLNGMNWRQIVGTVGKTVIACAPVAAGLVLSLNRFGDAWQTGSTFQNLGILLLLGGVSAVVVAGLYIVLRVEIVHAAVMRRRAGKRGTR